VTARAGEDVPLGIIVDATLVTPADTTAGVADFGHECIHADLQFFIVAPQTTILDRVAGQGSATVAGCREQHRTYAPG
jgi:hypothetical protein